MSPSEAVKMQNKYYHNDCIKTKQEIKEIRDIYYEYVSDTDSFPVVSKVINDLIFKENYEINYVKFIVCIITSSGSRCFNIFLFVWLLLSC